MRIISVELVNFCQHADRVVNFHPGLNAIVGQNGAGKSNILNAIGFALTGTICNEGDKAENIRQQAAKTARSYVRLVFQHGDSSVIVQRNLRPKTPNATLTISGGAEIVGEAAVTAAIEQLLGVPKDVISNMVVVSHGELFGFLQQTQGARLAQFQKLFGLDRATQLYDGIGKYLGNMAVPVITETTATLQVQLATEQLDLASLEAKMAAELMNPANVETAIADCRKQLQVAVDADLAEYQLAGIRQDLKYCEVRHADGKARADQLRSVCAGLQSQHDQLDTAAAGAAVAGWSAYQSALQAVATVQRRVESATVGTTAAELVLANHEIARSSINPLLEPDTYPAVLSQLSLYQSQIHMLQLTAGLVLGEDCLTCGAPARDVAERVTVAIKDLCDVQESHSIVSKQLEASQQWFADYNRYRHALEVASAEYEVATTALANIPSVQPVTSCEEAKTVLATAKRLTEELNTAKIELVSLDVYIADLAGRISQLLLQVAAQEKVCAALVRMNADEVQAVNTELSTWLEVQVAIRACELQRATLRERVDSTRRRIVNVQQAERQVATVTHLRELLTSVRGIFHKESAPALVIQSNLHRLQAEINRQLSLFDADYRVQVADGASFTALFEGGIVQPVQRLSYGQKVALAFSFRLALNRTVIPQVNGLYLDEPTAYLDVRRIDAFAPVFEQLRQASQSTGLQCVIVTHERRLSHLFDNVVEVL